MDADVRGVAAARVGGLEEDSVGDAGFGGDVPGLDVVEAAGGFAADGDGGGSVADDGVVDLDVVGGAVDAEAVGVAAGFQAEGVVVDVDVGVGDVDVVGGVDVDAVGGGAAAAFVVADDDAVDGDVVRVEDLDGPEAGALEGDAAAEVDVGGVLEEDEADALGVVVGGPAEALGVVDLREVAVDLPPDGAVLVDGAFAGDGDVVLVADVDEGGGPGHLDAGDAGGEFGEVLDVLGAGEGDAFGDVEGDAGFQEEGAGEVGAGLEADGLLLGRGGVDGFLDGGGVEGGAVAFGAVVVDQQRLRRSRRSGSESKRSRKRGTRGPSRRLLITYPPRSGGRRPAGRRRWA